MYIAEQMRIKKFQIFLCAFIVLPVFTCVMFHYILYDTSQTIDTPYTFPITPNMEEWASFRSRDEMVAACQIPEEILSKLSTHALVETILTYPFLSEITMFYRTQMECDRELGFWRIANSFNGLQELLTRDDALSVLEDYGKFDDLTYNSNVLVIIYRNIEQYQRTIAEESNGSALRS